MWWFSASGWGRLFEEAGNFAQRLPELIRKHGDLSTVKVPSLLEPLKAALRGAAATTQLRHGPYVPLLQRTAGHLATVLGSLGFLILVPILTFLFLKDGEQIREDLLAWIPARHRKLTDDIVEDIHLLLVQYIRALVILSVLTSVVYLIFFESIGLPYAVLLSVLAAPLEFIPFIGPLVGTLLILGVAIFTSFPHVWWIVIFFALYRAFQDYFVQPYLLSAGIELHPLIVIFGALAGQQVGGIWGMFLSVPVLAAIRVILVNVRRRQKLRESLLVKGATQSAPPSLES
ncbi:MAG: AI-2E family transporter [Bryobacteraceae bacterium]